MNRNSDPFAFITAHQNLIFTILGVLGMLLLLFLLIRIPVRRAGGWKASWAAVRREAAATAHAFVAPLAALRAHRRALRLLVRHLRSPHSWRDAERAVTAARLAAARQAPADRAPRPYAALVDDESVTVLLAGTAADAPDAPWAEDLDDPSRWTVRRQDLPAVTPYPDDGPPVLVATGSAGGSCVFIDLACGPATTAVEGDTKTAQALVRVIAAQLDTRLPDGLVTVAEGVHPRHPGAPVREAFRAARDTEPRHGIAPVLVAAELPDPLPEDFATSPSGPPRPRILVPGRARGHTRRLVTDRHGQVLLAGTGLLTAANALGRAVAKALPHIPPVLPPPPAGQTSDPGAASLFDEFDEEAYAEPAAVSGRAATGAAESAPARTAPGLPRQSRAAASDEPSVPVASARAGGTAAGPAASAASGAADGSTAPGDGGAQAPPDGVPGKSAALGDDTPGNAAPPAPGDAADPAGGPLSAPRS
ncbi:hypothetical protein [Streptomyces sp. NPDC048644]|uniref:hypothetical protein n=1 Tax=Streptomyces sp. NPDC048644 TaxID=3365582 RepID=UPI00371EDE4C